MSEPASLSPSRLPVWVSRIAIVAVIFAAYFNSLHCPFLFDDLFDTVECRYIRNLWPLWEVITGAPPNAAASGRPIVSLSLAINYTLGGLNPFGYHVFNLLVHIANALLLFAIIRRTLSPFPSQADGRSGGSSTSALFIASAAALLWAAHPLATEAVTYVIKRNESLMAFFYLLTLYCFIRGVASANSRCDGLWRSLAVVACALGMATKEIMVTAPAIVYLYDRTFVEKCWLAPLRRRPVFYAALAATWLLLALLVHGNPRSRTTGFSIAEFTPASYFLTQLTVVPYYLRLAFWPSRLCIDYLDWPAVHSLQDAAPAVFIAALVAATAWAVFKKPALGFLGAWFFIILAPSSTIIPIREPACEYRMYLALAALAVLVAATVWRVAAGVTAGRRTQSIPPSALPFGGLFICVLVVLLALRTRARNDDYRSPETMWADVVAKRPNNPRGRVNLANQLARRGQLDAASEHYQAALLADPGHMPSLLGLANVYTMLGRANDAIFLYERALAIDPNYGLARSGLGVLYATRNQWPQAVEHLEVAVRVRPDLPHAHLYLARAYAALGRANDAIAQYEQVVALDPTNQEARQALAKLAPAR